MKGVRRLRTLVIVLSAALCLVMVAMWARSYRLPYGEGRIWRRHVATPGIIGERLRCIHSARGTIRVVRAGWRCERAAWPQVRDLLEATHAVHIDVFDAAETPHSFELNQPPPPDTGWMRGVLQRVGFCFYGDRMKQRNFHSYYVLFTAPYWFIVLLTAIAPARAGLSAYRRLMRFRRGQCTVCGYDLRGGSECCPECGTTISTPRVDRSAVDH